MYLHLRIGALSLSVALNWGAEDEDTDASDGDVTVSEDELDTDLADPGEDPTAEIHRNAGFHAN